MTDALKPSVGSSHAVTVCGPVATSQLGITLAHEHLILDISSVFVEPEAEDEKRLSQETIRLDNLGWIHRNYISNLDNLRLTDESIALSEIRKFAEAGGRTVVDPTVVGLHPQPEALVRISEQTGLFIILGCGYYVEATHPPELAGRSVDSITEELINDISVGMNGSSIRAGLIGELGCSAPWTDAEKKVVEAGTYAQLATGAALMIHPGRDQRLPLEHLRFVEKKGGDVTRTIMCHVERTIFDRAILSDLADTGCYVEYDMFGAESCHYPFADIDLPNDAGRLDALAWLLERGHGEQLLISQDVCFKIHWTKYGGQGYAHILKHIVPLMRRRGFTKKNIHQILIDNPARIFSLKIQN